MKQKFKTTASILLGTIIMLISGNNLQAQQHGKQGPPPLPNDKQIEQMVDNLSKELSLTEDQEKKVSEEYFAHFDEVKVKTESGRPDRKVMETMKSDFEKDIKSLLTREQQEIYEDYLLKPIGYSDFMKAAQKAKDIYFSQETKVEKIESDEKFLFIKSEYKIVRINLSDIKYIEGMREYVRIHIESQKPVMTLMSMKKMEEYLPDTKFMRVHRSFIINLEKITTIERNRIIFDEDVFIPVSDQYKAKFQEFVDNNFLL